MVLIDSMTFGHDHYHSVCACVRACVRVCLCLCVLFFKLQHSETKQHRAQNIACDVHAVFSEGLCLFFVELLGKWDKRCFISVLITFLSSSFSSGCFYQQTKTLHRHFKDDFIQHSLFYICHSLQMMITNGHLETENYCAWQHVLIELPRAR